MNHRHRYVACLTFQPLDRVPFAPGHGRESTRRRWYAEGLPTGVNPVVYAADYLGLPHQAIDRSRPIHPPFDFRMIPQFEEQVIERRPNSQIVQDWKGNICEIGLEYDVTYLRNAIDFVTRSWIRCPVETREDWQAMKRRYDIDAPGRWPTDWIGQTAAMRDRTYVAGLTFPGPFWQLREWLGFEGLCMMTMDDPAFVDEMVAFWRRFVSLMLDRILQHFTPDFVCINEDMAYKQKPMIGPDQSRRFMLDCWSDWGQLLQQAGVPIYEVDSDGYIGDLIPVWLEAGANCNSPLEVAAGNDLPTYRQCYGKRMAWRGGVDKRAIAAGGEVIENEIARLMPVIDAGGFIPGCDHAIPHDVSWPNFLHYCRLLAQATGWL